MTCLWVASHTSFIWSFFYIVSSLTLPLTVHPRKQWSKRKEMKRRREKQSRILFTSSFCISVVPLWQKRGSIEPCTYCEMTLRFKVYQLSSLVPISVNLIQITCIWLMQILWQRWVIEDSFGYKWNFDMCTIHIKTLIFLCFVFRVAILVRKKKERKWWKMLKMRCPLRCDSQNW